MSVIAKNPILPGFYPDPSICAAGEDFYLVNSTFSYFPGLPLMHSRDLAHWEQIGNVMDRQSQLPLTGCGHSEGLFAPSIRFHQGTFYVICTNVSGGGNFIVTAKQPEGPWSEPYYLEGADGIDPSLFFDEDGTCYYIGTHPNPDGCRYDGDWYIWIQQLDIKKMCLVGKKYNVWNGSMRNVIWPEGPHLYKKDGYYYILHAEGGTGSDHAITICRSRDIFGPYENNPKNPILTHRHMGKNYPVQCVGHGDLVETLQGDWYMVMLATRPMDGCTLLGRETFLAEVTWEDGWPIVNAGSGSLCNKVEIQLEEWIPEEGTTVLGNNRRIYAFDHMETLPPEIIMLRNPYPGQYRLLPGQGLKLSSCKATLQDEDSPSYAAIRQQHYHFRVSGWVCLKNLGKNEVAGLALVQSNLYHLRIEAGTEKVEVILCKDGVDQVVGSYLTPKEEYVCLSLYVIGLQAYVGVDEDMRVACEEIDISSLSTESAGGFVGCTVGLYASSNGCEPEGYAMFKTLTYTVK